MLMDTVTQIYTRIKLASRNVRTLLVPVRCPRPEDGEHLPKHVVKIKNIDNV